MATSDWINLIAAILVGGGTFFLGIMAWRTIRQTRSIQKAEKRERLLNEIIEWATLITSQSTATLFERLPDIIGDSRKHSMYIYAYLSRVRANLEGAVGKNIYMLSIAHLFNLNLSVSIATLVHDMTSYMEFLDIWQEKSTNMLTSEIKLEEHDIDELDTLSNCVNISAIGVIEQATKIKTRDMGNKEENMSKEGEPVRSNEIILKDIEKHLTRIEGYVIQIRKNMKAQGVGGFGFTGMAAGMALVATGVQTTGGLVIFGVGLIVTLYSFYFM